MNVPTTDLLSITSGIQEEVLQVLRCRSNVHNCTQIDTDSEKQVKIELVYFINNIRSVQLSQYETLTGVCIIITRWSRICRTISSGYTGSFASIRHMAVSIKIRTPVRPIPAEQWTMAGSTIPARARLTLSVNERNLLMSSGTPWSGHARYCIWVISRDSPVYEIHIIFTFTGMQKVNILSVLKVRLH